MSISGPLPGDSTGQLSGTRSASPVPEQLVERIGKPAARPQPRSRTPFNRQTWWAILLVAVGVVYLATALGFQHVHNENTVIVFGQVTEQAAMPWYYDHPVVRRIRSRRAAGPCLRLADHDGDGNPAHRGGSARGAC